MVKGEVAPSSRCRFDFLMIVSYWYWETINNIGSNYGYVGEEILLFNELVPYLSWLLSCEYLVGAYTRQNCWWETHFTTKLLVECELRAVSKN